MQKTTAISLAAAAAITATGNGTGVDISGYTGIAKFILDASATGGAGQTLDVKIQHSNDNSSWADAGIAFAQVTNTSASFQSQNVNVDGLRKYIRVVDTLAGSSPTATRSVAMVGQKAIS